MSAVVVAVLSPCDDCAHDEQAEDHEALEGQDVANVGHGLGPLLELVAPEIARAAHTFGHFARPTARDRAVDVVEHIARQSGKIAFTVRNRLAQDCALVRDAGQIR